MPRFVFPQIIPEFLVFRQSLVKAGINTGTWITREPGSGVGYYTDQYFREADIQPKKIIHVNNSGLIRRIVSQGVGQALLSDQDIPENVPAEKLGTNFIRDFYLVNRDENKDDAILQRVEEIIKVAESQN